MVFVINRRCLIAKQSIFVAVSTACIRLYSAAASDATQKSMLKNYMSIGQMKVVVKADSTAELSAIVDVARSRGIPAISLSNSEIGSQVKQEGPPKTKRKASVDSLVKQEQEDNNSLAIVALVGWSEDLDQITGHLKLF